MALGLTAARVLVGKCLKEALGLFNDWKVANGVKGQMSTVAFGKAAFGPERQRIGGKRESGIWDSGTWNYSPLFGIFAFFIQVLSCLFRVVR